MSKNREHEHVLHNRGKWSKKGVPHKGWRCIEIEDLGEPSTVCEMCESQEIRYVHHMEHPDFLTVLSVGCICAGHMEEDLVLSRRRDDFMKSRAGKRMRWLSRSWRLPSKGNEYLKSDGYLVTVFSRKDEWKAVVKNIETGESVFSRKRYENSDQIKLASFDLITKYLSES